jgi:phosphatidylinositol-4-phosphate 3-kinase
MIEMVTSAETLRKIQVELGLTGSFKDRPIAEWLARQNPSALEYERAVENFTGILHTLCINLLKCIGLIIKKCFYLTIKK